jgi:phage major head subunit gpT-like protein
LFNSTAVTTAGGHANLLTTALGTTYTAWEAASAAMFNQPMHIKNAVGIYGTGKKQGVDPKFCLVPRALRGAANDLFITRQNSADNKNVENLYFGQVYPLTVPEWTDATDWAQVADPNILPGIMLGEIFGLMPQIVIAGKETDGAMFANDESRLKIRQFLTVGIGNWRALSKSNVA